MQKTKKGVVWLFKVLNISYKYDMEERYSAHLGANLSIERVNENGEREILLQLRQNTGYMNGYWEFAAGGHLEEGESFSEALIREVKEEIGVDILPEDLQFGTIIHFVEEKYVIAYFRTKKYYGIPTIKDVDKVADLRWFPYNALPDNIIPGDKEILQAMDLGVLEDSDKFENLKRVLNSK